VERMPYYRSESDVCVNATSQDLVIRIPTSIDVVRVDQFFVADLTSTCTALSLIVRRGVTEYVVMRAVSVALLPGTSCFNPILVAGGNELIARFAGATLNDSLLFTLVGEVLV